MKYLLALSVFALVLSSVLVPTLSARAVDPAAATPAPAASTPTPAVASVPTELQLVNPLGGTKQKPAGVTSAVTLIGTAIKMVMGVVGALVLLMFFWGATMWIGGNAEKIKGGAKTMAWAAIGALAVFASYLLLKFTLPFFGN